MEALAARCDEAGRDPATLETSFLTFMMIDEDGDKARAHQRTFLAERGLDITTAPEDVVAKATERHFVGSPDDVAEQVQTRILDHGIDGVVINLITNGEEPGIVDLAGRTLGPTRRQVVPYSHFTIGTGSYLTVRVFEEISAPLAWSVITRVSLTVNPGAPLEATQPGPSGKVTVFGDVGDVRGPVVDVTSTVLVPQIRTGDVRRRRNRLDHHAGLRQITELQVDRTIEDGRLASLGGTARCSNCARCARRRPYLRNTSRCRASSRAG